MTELETIVLDWLAKLLALPECFHSTGPTRGGGVIQGSASEAVVTAMVAARDKYLRETVPAHLEGEEREEAVAMKRSKMVALGSSTTHSSTKKAAIILGVRFQTIPVTAEDNYALTGRTLRAKLDSCRAKGLEPFFLTATLGTTDTCAVDDFADIADTLAAFRQESTSLPSDTAGGEVWVHVDAAYAGAALVCPEVQEATKIGLVSRFHSFNMNMHKWLLTNFDASCLFVRDREWFVQALTVNQAVYSNAASSGGLVTDYREWQIPLGRRFRSLKIWFVMRSYGAEGLRSHIRRTTRLGETFAGLLGGRPDLFEILTGPSFALTVFRMVGGEAEKAGGEDSQLEVRNTLTRKLYETVNSSGKMWVTSTELDGRFAIRLMTGVRTTQEEHVQMAFQMLVDLAEGIQRE